MFVVYIIFSKKLDRFYIGTTDDFDLRLSQHNSLEYKDSFTSRGIPWETFLIIDSLTSEQAFKIEGHIKSMKSTKYVRDLEMYTEMVERLKLRFK
jgi:putative endonuclease